MTLTKQQIEQVLALRDSGEDYVRICTRLDIDGEELRNHEVDTIESIEDCLEEGTTNATEIAKKLDLPVHYITGIACDYELENVKVSRNERIKLLKKRRELMLRKKQEQKNFEKRRRSKKNLEQETGTEGVSVNAEIDLLVAQGTDFNTIVEVTDLSDAEVLDYLKQSKQDDLVKGKPREKTQPAKSRKTRVAKRVQRILAIDNVVDDGLSLGEMRILGNFSNQSGPRNYLVTTGQHARWKVGRNKKLGVKPKKQYERIPAVDAIIKNTGTLDEIKEAGGWPTTKEAIAYMIKTIQYTRWRTRIEQLEEEKKQRKTAAENLTSSTKSKYEKPSQLETETVYQEPKTVEEKVEEKVSEFFTGKERKTISRNDATKFYTNFFKAQANGKKPFVYQLSHGTELSEKKMTILLRDVGLKPPRSKT